MDNELAYKVYVTDSLRGLYHAMGGQIEIRFYDMIKEEKKVDTRTAEEIIQSIREKLGGGN